MKISMWTPLSGAVVAMMLLQGCASTSSKSLSAIDGDLSANQPRKLRSEFAASDFAKQRSDYLGSRYYGFVKLSDSAKLPVVVDLTPDGQPGAVRSMRAVIRLHLGNFDSPEFVSFYFPQVTSASLNQSEGDLTFVTSTSGVSTLSVKDAYVAEDRLSAQLELATTVDGGRRPMLGFLQAIRLGTGPSDPIDRNRSEASVVAFNKILAIEPDLKTVEPISGEYIAQCNGSTSVLQLDFARFAQSKTYAPFAFSPFTFSEGMFGSGTITGRLGPAEQDNCSGDSQGCDVRIFKAGSFEPFAGELLLRSTDGDLKCQVDQNGIYCGSCKFARRSGSATLAVKEFSRSDDMVIEPGSALNLESDPASLAGSFYGYLHHENSDLYQPVSLRLDYVVDAMAYSSVAALYFGNTDQNEFVVYQFDPVGIRQLANHVVLDGPGESYLVLTSAGEKAVAGIWYSKTRGRIGTVSMARNSMPPLMVDQSKLVGSLKGSYSSANWKVDLFVASNVSETPADYSALRIFGAATEVIDPSRQRLIRQGTFDFYTGTVAFKLDDGRVIHGSVHDGKLSLYWPVWPKFGEGVTPREQLSFTRTSKPDQTIAARK